MEVLLDKYRLSGSFIRVQRGRPSHPLIHGYVVDVSASLCLIHGFHDFIPSGYHIVRVNDIDDVRSDEREELFHRIVTAEGLLGGLAGAPSIDLDSMPGAITSVQEQFGRLILQCEDDDGEDFYIGSVMNVSTDTVLMRNFDAYGRWEEDLHTIDVADITHLQIESPYLTTFWKYLKPSEPGDTPDRESPPKPRGTGGWRRT